MISNPRLALASAAAVSLFAVGAILAQPTSRSPLAPPANGPARNDSTWVALSDCTVHIDPQTTMEHATVVFRDGKITAVLPAERLSADDPSAKDAPRDAKGPIRTARVPLGPRVIPASNMHVYAAFIDPYVEIDVAALPAGPGRHPIARVTPEREASTALSNLTPIADSLRAIGFGTAAIAPRGGVFRGFGAVVSLSKVPDERSAARPPVYRDHVYQSVALERAGDYPDSEMGAIAVLRQTLSDADWQQQARANGTFNEGPNALDALVPPPPAPKTAAAEGADLPAPPALAPLLFDTNNKLQILRAAKIADEFRRPFAILGSGTEYQNLGAVREALTPSGGTDNFHHPEFLILPIPFAKAPDLSSPQKQENADLRELMSWEQAPTNPRRLAAAGISFSLTTAKLRDRNDFWPNLRKAIAHGLKAEDALAAITTRPAAILGLTSEFGTIEAGKRANLVITTGDIFKKKNEKDAPESKVKNPYAGKEPKFRAIIIDGQVHELSPEPNKPLKGTWQMAFAMPDPNAPKDGPPALLEFDDDNNLTAKVPKAPKAKTEGTGNGEQGTEKKEDVNKDEGKKEEAKKNDAKPEDGKKNDAAKPSKKEESKYDDVKPTKVQYDGARLSYVFDTRTPENDSMGVVTVAGVIDWNAEPPVYHATVFAKDGRRFDFAATRQPEKPKALALGKWRLIEADGFALDEKDAPETLEFAEKKFTLHLPGRTPVTPKTDAKGEDKPDPKADEKAAEKPAEMAEPKLSPVKPRPKPGAKPEAKPEVNPETKPDARPAAADEPKPAAKPAAKPDGKPEDKPDRKPEGIIITSDDVKYDGDTATFSHDLKPLGGEGRSNDTVKITKGEGDQPDTLVGESTLPGGGKHPYKAVRLKDDKKDAKDDKKEDEDDDALLAKDIPEQLGLPFGPYAVTEPRKSADLLVKHATIWTSATGNLADASIAIHDGKIAFVGTEKQLGDWFQKGVKLTQPWDEIDATGKHLTPGIIDCHSHTGISGGVNEAGRAISAQVRIADVTDPDAINWYRQLAGGVTTVNNLHGSANAIGGQNQVNKLRWGAAHPDDMHFAGAKPGIKFALGENPRQANSGDGGGDRYPATRMGVEMLIRDRFTAAKDYASRHEGTEARRHEGKSLSRGDSSSTSSLRASVPSSLSDRRDLELEALSEILKGDRLVHCHSYRQDEIVMLCNVAKDFGFKIGTFQHILEGYKVADYVKNYSGGGSAFSDWWAYKIEVQDAIPQGPPLMHEVGAVVSYNSDSDEMARRLNVEAAKAVKYGNLSEEEALKFVTLNPAKQLQIDKQVGSLEVGKDADFVIWSGNPLSSLSRCEQTWIDGKKYFSLEDDAKERAKITAERTRLIQKVLTEGKKKKARGDKDGKDGEKGEGDKADARPDGPRPEGGPPEGRRGRRRPPNEVDQYENQYSDEALLRAYYEDLNNRGYDPNTTTPGLIHPLFLDPNRP
jgi:imidazolonepropionase-like amidohydrolase